MYNNSQRIIYNITIKQNNTKQKQEEMYHGFNEKS